MECLVCKKTFDGGECPRCRFPVVNFPGDPEAGIRAMKPTLDAYRKSFLSAIEIGVVSYSWKAVGDDVVLAGSQTNPLGSCDAAMDNTLWLDQQFARNPELDAVDLQIYVKGAAVNTQKGVRVPNLRAACLQEVGLSLDESLRVTVSLRNAAGETASSEKTVLF